MGTRHTRKSDEIFSWIKQFLTKKSANDNVYNALIQIKLLLIIGIMTPSSIKEKKNPPRINIEKL